MKMLNLRRLVSYPVDHIKARMSEPTVRRLAGLQASLQKDAEDLRELAPIRARRSNLTKPRLNLLIPSINPNNTFGGLATALRFFEELSRPCEHARVLLTDTVPVRKALASFADYYPASMEDDTKRPRQIMSLSSRGQRTLAVGPRDVFVATAWHTAYLAQHLIAWQNREFNQPSNFMGYFIQDYEPGFYPWSSRHLLALNTYRYDGPVVAVFNTDLLRRYFHSQDCIFDYEYSFEPRMNKHLRDLLPDASDPTPQKRQQLLIYGRPTVPRNAFGLIVQTLRIWRTGFSNSSAWTVISAGEPHRKIDLGGGSSIVSVGKLDLKEYARILTESSVGLSLMISPHPSYPPLEMAHYGVRVLTNCWDGKNLSLCHDNITSIEYCSPESLARGLIELCRQVEADATAGWRGQSYMEHYLSGNPAFPFVEEVRKHLIPSG